MFNPAEHDAPLRVDTNAVKAIKITIALSLFSELSCQKI